MAPMSSLHSLRVGRRKGAYQAVSSQDQDEAWDDLEKRQLIEDNDYLSESASNVSSRVSSASHQPMLHTSAPSRWRPSLFTIRSPRAFTRCFTLVIGTVLIVFITTLFRMGVSSTRAVELAPVQHQAGPPVWESFPFLKRYHGGIRTLVKRSENKPEYPGEGKNIPAVEKAIEGRDDREATTKPFPKGRKFDPYAFGSAESSAAFAPRETCYLDEAQTIKIPQLLAYDGVTQGMPDNVIGSYDVLGLSKDVCFERFGRLGPYGLGYSKKLGGSGSALQGHREGAEDVWNPDPEVDFRKVKWADVQDKCLQANADRLAVPEFSRHHFFQSMTAGGPEREASRTLTEVLTDNDVDIPAVASISATNSTQLRKRAPSQRLARNAVIIRTWWDYKYDDEDVWYLRALISELAVQSGGEYTVHFLIHVKDDNIPIWSDDETHARVLNESLPEEFRGMGTLWSERQMGLLYGGMDESFFRNLPVHGAYRSTYMPVQYFAHEHPEYDFFWQWEMDLRYTGHFYHLFDKISCWAKKQPRKLMWERSSRFYVPSEHGTWEEFNGLVKYQTEHGTGGSKNNMYAKLREYHADLPPNAQAPGKAEDPIWGPLPPLDDELETQNDQHPPEGISFKDDNYEWGVGEDADLITLNPLFDPDGTNWILAEDVTGYNTTRGLPPRRTAIVTAGRLSRRLLETMHRESALKRHTMFSEMWPASCALHHGFKAVYAPHPVFIDRRWPTDYLAAIFNGGRNGASGGARLSIFSDERQHNFKGTTWYYNAGFPENLWRRWLGYKVDNDGGEEWEVENEGRMCLPAMLLHPVKEVPLVYDEAD